MFDIVVTVYPRPPSLSLSLSLSLPLFRSWSSHNHLFKVSKFFLFFLFSSFRIFLFLACLSLTHTEKETIRLFLHFTISLPLVRSFFFSTPKFSGSEFDSSPSCKTLHCFSSRENVGSNGVSTNLTSRETENENCFEKQERVKRTKREKSLKMFAFQR